MIIRVGGSETNQFNLLLLNLECYKDSDVDTVFIIQLNFRINEAVGIWWDVYGCVSNQQLEFLIGICKFKRW